MFDGSNAAGLHVRDQVFLDGAEILELLIKVAGEQQYGVFQLAFTVVQRSLAETPDHDCGADGDCSDQQQAAENEPPDRIVADGGLTL